MFDLSISSTLWCEDFQNKSRHCVVLQQNVHYREMRNGPTKLSEMVCL